MRWDNLVVIYSYTSENVTLNVEKYATQARNGLGTQGSSGIPLACNVAALAMD